MVLKTLSSITRDLIYSFIAKGSKGIEAYRKSLDEAFLEDLFIDTFQNAIPLNRNEHYETRLKLLPSSKGTTPLIIYCLRDHEGYYELRIYSDRSYRLELSITPNSTDKKKKSFGIGVYEIGTKDLTLLDYLQREIDRKVNSKSPGA